MTQRIGSRLSRAAGRPDCWLAGLLLWTLISAGRSLGTHWTAAAVTEALRWGGGIGLALVGGWYGRRTQLAGQFLVTLTGALALLGILGSGSVAGGLVGPYHDHQLYGSVLLLLLPFSAALSLTASQTAWRWGALASFSAGTLCLFLSQTRSAWIGLVAAGLIFGWLWVSRNPIHRRQWRLVFTPVLLLLFGLLAVWHFAGPADQKIALGHRATTLTRLSQDESWQSRLSLWYQTIHLIEAHPASGIGLGRFSGQIGSISGSRRLPLVRPSLSTEAHSFYLQTAAEIGLIGLTLYLGVLITFTRLALQRLGAGHGPLRERDGMLIAALSALAGQGIDAFASPSWQFPEVSLFFWAILGLGLAALRPEEAQAVSFELRHPVRRFGQWALSGSLAVVLAAQILPIGLLPPVEAYNHVAAVSFQSLTLVSATCTSGSPPCFALKALYSDGGIQDVTFDSGGVTNQPSGFTCFVAPSYISSCISSFGTGTTRNQLKVAAGDTGKLVRISGSFDDVVYTTTVLVGTPTYSRKGSQPYPLQL